MATSDPFELASSSAWADRARAATALASEESSAARRQTLALLSSDPDTAVVESAIKALAARDDDYGADLIFEGVAAADADVADHALYFLARVIADDTELGRGLLDRAHRRASDGSSKIQQGAAEVVGYFE